MFCQGLHHLGEQMDHRFSVSSAASESRRAKRQAGAVTGNARNTEAHAMRGVAESQVDAS